MCEVVTEVPVGSLERGHHSQLSRRDLAAKKEPLGWRSKRERLQVVMHSYEMLNIPVTSANNNYDLFTAGGVNHCEGVTGVSCVAAQSQLEQPADSGSDTGLARSWDRDAHPAAPCAWR